MDIFISKFNTTAEYNAQKGALLKPHVSLTKDDGKVHYIKEAFVIAKFNITETGSTDILSEDLVSSDYNFKTIIVDNVAQNTIQSAYTFTTLGEHEVKYVFNDDTVPREMLRRLSAVTSVDVSNGVKTIKYGAFEECENLASAKLGNGVNRIDSMVFYEDESLLSVKIPDSVTELDDGIFWGCSNLTSVKLGSGMTKISNEMFYECSSLSSITIPNSVIEIGEWAFQYCSSLSSITIPSSVTVIGEDVFDYCSRLSSVHISDLAAWCNISFANKDANPLAKAHHLYLNGEEVTHLEIPDGVTSIGNYAFNYCSGLHTVQIPSSVTSIGTSAFNGCSGLANIISLATTAPTITNTTFQDVDGSGDLTIPSGSSGYDTWMQNANYYLGKYGWYLYEE